MSQEAPESLKLHQSCGKHYLKRKNDLMKFWLTKEGKSITKKWNSFSSSTLKNGPKCRHIREKLQLLICWEKGKSLSKLNMNKIHKRMKRTLSQFRRSLRIKRLIVWKVMWLLSLNRRPKNSSVSQRVQIRSLRKSTNFHKLLLRQSNRRRILPKEKDLPLKKSKKLLKSKLNKNLTTKSIAPKPQSAVSSCSTKWTMHFWPISSRNPMEAN